MDYEQFKERIEEDLHQALADHGDYSDALEAPVRIVGKHLSGLRGCTPAAYMRRSRLRTTFRRFTLTATELEMDPVHRLLALKCLSQDQCS